MEHRNSITTVVTLTGISAALLMAAPAAHAAPAAPTAVQPVCADYHPVALGEDGRVSAAALDAVTEAVRRDVKAGSKEITILIHGFNVDPKYMDECYSPLALDLRQQGQETGLHTSVVGLHWSSEVGKNWLLKATGSRLASLVGAKRAVKNPYLEKCQVARESGREGLRALCFRLQDRFPGVPVHLFTHSMGAQVAVAALAPEAGRPEPSEVEQPQRILRVGMVMLAGADLDYNVFAREESEERNALRRAKLWWVTSPEQGVADGVLELRRGAGKCDAMGNRGLKLEAEDLNQLISRRALVLDEGRVPAKHAFGDYYNQRRVHQLALSMRYMENPNDAIASGSVLARLDQVLKGGTVPGDCASLRLYTAWKQDGNTGKVRSVALKEQKGDDGSKVAGVRQELRTPRGVSDVATR